MDWSEFMSLAKDCILAVAAITGAVVAVKGLSTWKRQLRGQAEYELARRILVTLFKYRDVVNGVRHPAMWAYEMPSPSAEEAKGMSSEKIQFYGTSRAYQARWEKVSSVRSSLYADLLEGEAIWDGELKSLFKALFDLEHELFTSVRHYLALINPETDGPSKEAIDKIVRAKREVMYDDLTEAGDDFKKEFRLGVEAIEKYLKPKLSR